MMNVRQSMAVLCALGVLCASYGLVAAQDHGKQKGHEVDYKNPGNWGDTCTFGKNQAPINITGGINAKLSPLAIAYSGKQEAIFRLNDHAVPQVDYAGPKEIPGSGHTLEIDGRKFDLKQFHFHTPSENQIEGEKFAMEGHFVHYSGDDIAVIAVMFKLGKTNDKLALLWKDLPTKERPKSAVRFSPAGLLPESRGYYRFNGSLTTPPCKEGVRWLVLKTPVPVSQAQVDAFLATLPGKSPNARPLQKLYNRSVQQ